MASAQWSQLGQDIDGEAAYDLSGYSVALSSDGARLAVGARNNDNANGDGAGQVRVFQWDRDSGSWTQLGDDIDGEAAGDHSGYSVALSSDGARVAIGAPGNDDFGTFAGQARVYEWNSVSSSWVQLGPDLNGQAAYDNLGGSVDLSSDGMRLAVGALGNDNGGFDAGHVRILDWDNGSSSWLPVGSDIRGEAAGDQSGSAVALSPDGLRVAIGARLNNGNGTASGHARVFEWDVGSSDWIQLGSDLDGEAAYDHAGSSVALSTDGSRLAVGAWSNDGGGADSGQVRVFEWQGALTGWVQLGADIDGEAEGDASGTSVALSSGGTRIAIGAIGSDGASGGDSGQVRVYTWQGSAWVQLGPDIDGEGAGDQSGVSVALTPDASRLAIGAMYNDNVNGDNSGQTRVFTDAVFFDDFETGTSDRWSSVSP